jgi:hypothetical protein
MIGTLGLGILRWLPETALLSSPWNELYGFLKSVFLCGRL